MAITINLKKQRETHLWEQINTDLERKDYERFPWEAWTPMSAVWLHSPPDHFGYIEDPVFQAVMVTYIGQPCPTITPVVGTSFGRKGARVDQYGANLAAAALPGQGHSVLHNKLQSMVQSMMKLGSIHLEKEAANFLLGKVGDPLMISYMNHVARQTNTRRTTHAIVPDIHTRNFPAGRHMVFDSRVIPRLRLSLM